MRRGWSMDLTLREPGGILAPAGIIPRRQRFQSFLKSLSCSRFARSPPPGAKREQLGECAMKGAQPHVCVVGSTNVDLFFRTARLPRPGETLAGQSFHLGYGGKGANQAVMAA